MDTRGPKVTENVKGDIVEGPMMTRLDPSWRFYIKMVWYKDRMGAVLLQSDDTVE